MSFILTTTFNGVWMGAFIIITKKVTFIKIYEFFWSDVGLDPVIKSMKGPDSTQIPSSKNPHLKTEMRIFIIYRIESNIKIHLTGRI